MSEKMIRIRFYEELNDFLERNKRKVVFEHSFKNRPSIKDIIESIGVPHPEIDLILVDGQSVGFDFQPAGGEYVSVYPVFESLDISPVVRLRPTPLRNPRFVADVNLGKLARWLRLCGFDTFYRNDLADQEIAGLAARDNRIILTRDQKLLKIKTVTHGYWVRETIPEKQIHEIVIRMDLLSLIKAFSRCLDCNGLITQVPKPHIEDRLPEKTRCYYEDFYMCQNCKKIYWRGSHYQRMIEKLELMENKIRRQEK